jgi:predicted dehydrogenase
MHNHPHRILVIGCGSIGERHTRTFLATGRATVLACDTRPEVLAHIGARYGVATTADWEAALADPGLTCAVIATPAPLHVQQALRVLAAGRHVLIEKPLAVELAGADALPDARDRAGVFAAMAYVQHCHPALRAARAIIQSGRFGAVRHVVFSGGQHFPTFRPAYREIYFRDRALGGGAIQDALTHLINTIEWMLGPTTRMYCDADRQVLDGVAVEDTINVAARNGGALVNYALNLFQVPNEMSFLLHAETGSVRVDYQAARVGTLARGASDWTWQQTVVEDRDTLFTLQANAFLDGCEGKPQPLGTVEEGIQTLRATRAALQSWHEGRAIDL